MLEAQLFFVLYLIALIVIAYYSSKKIKIETFMQDYYLAGRGLGAWVVGMVAMSALASGGTLIGTPSIVWGYGFVGGLWQTQGFMYGLIAVGIIGKRIAELSGRVNAISLTDLMRERFGRGTGIICTIIIIAVLFPYAAAQFVASARVLEVTLGIDYVAGIITFAVIIALYLSLGGIRAQMFTSVIQSVLMLIAAVVGMIVVLVVLGGLGPITTALGQQNPEFLIPPGPDGWMPIPFYISYGIMLPAFAAMGQPHVVTRFFALGPKQSYRVTMFTGGAVTILWFLPLVIIGLGARAIFPELASPDFAFPMIALELFPAFIAGIFLAGMVAAMMSTVDAMLLTVSASFTKDIYQRVLNPQASGQKLRLAGILSTLVLSVGAIIIALYPPDFVLFLVLAAFGTFGVSFGPAIIAGLFWKRANAHGAFASMLIGFVVTAGLHLPMIPTNPLGFHAVGWGGIASVLALFIVTLLTPPSEISVLRKFYSAREVTEVNTGEDASLPT